MPRTTLHLRAPDPAKPVALFAQIANSIADHIRGGRLASGDVLPGSRALARDLGVDRDTVIAAYTDLEAQGFIATVPRTGTVVADLPREVTARRGFARQVGFALDAGPPRLGAPPEPPDALVLAAGVPDLRLVPAAYAYSTWGVRYPPVTGGKKATSSPVCTIASCAAIALLTAMRKVRPGASSRAYAPPRARSISTTSRTGAWSRPSSTSDSPAAPNASRSRAR